MNNEQKLEKIKEFIINCEKTICFDCKYEETCKRENGCGKILLRIIDGEEE